jgi:hypothetical protein
MLSYASVLKRENKKNLLAKDIALRSQRHSNIKQSKLISIKASKESTETPKKNDKKCDANSNRCKQ